MSRQSFWNKNAENKRVLDFKKHSEAFDEGKRLKSNNGAAVRLRVEGLQGCKRWSLLGIE
jgi:hypothetical protein